MATLTETVLKTLYEAGAVHHMVVCKGMLADNWGIIVHYGQPSTCSALHTQRGEVRAFKTADACLSFCEKYVDSVQVSFS